MTKETMINRRDITSLVGAGAVTAAAAASLAAPAGFDLSNWPDPEFGN